MGLESALMPWRAPGCSSCCRRRPLRASGYAWHPQAQPRRRRRLQRAAPPLTCWQRLPWRCCLQRRRNVPPLPPPWLAAMPGLARRRGGGALMPRRSFMLPSWRTWWPAQPSRPCPSSQVRLLLPQQPSEVLAEDPRRKNRCAGTLALPVIVDSQGGGWLLCCPCRRRHPR